MRKDVLKKSLLASSVAMVVGSVAHAQDNAGVNEEELIVTGIRASLERAMDLKRNSTGVVDAITAEDIGKFPDTNLAESLQRITGVSIDRKNGEGFQITVRGFGPEFNQVTLNGRTMPTAQLNETGGLRSDRGFDMSNIASEGVSGVAVYKSGQADITSGGIGATVDLSTRKPFDSEGLKFSVGAKALHDTTTRVGDDVTPEVAGFISWSNDMFGVSASVSYQERDSARTGAFTNGWNDGKGAWVQPTNPLGGEFDENRTNFTNGNIPNGITRLDNAACLPDDPQNSCNHNNITATINGPAEGTLAQFTPGLRYNHMDVERTRTNGQLTLQFRPIENLEFTLDYTTAEQEIEMNRAEFSFWFGGGAFPTTGVQFDGNPNAATPLYWLTENPGWSAATPGNFARDVNFGVQGGSVENSLDSVGFNAKWNVNDEFTLKFDYHTSEAEALPGGNGPGNWYNVGIGGQGVPVQGIDNSGDLPLLVGIWDERDGYNGNTADAIDVADLGSTVRQINFDRVTQEVDQVRIDGSWEFADSGAINFGIESRDMETTNKSSFDQSLLEGGWGVANPGDVPADMVEEINLSSLFDGYRSEMSTDARAFFRDAYVGTGNDTVDMATFDSRFQTFGATAYIGDANALGALLSANNNLDWAPNPVDGTNRLIEEEVDSAYVQVDLNGEVGEMPFNVLAGVRYEGTDVASTSQIGQTIITWQGDNDFLVQAQDASNAEIQVFEASYDHVLPAVSISLDVTEDIVARMAWSKTIARPSYNFLQQGLSGVGGPVGGPTVLGAQNGGGNNGNVGLLPVESDNFDFSVEWYFDDASYLSVGYYDKRVNNFIGNEEVETAAMETETRDPSAGPRAQAALAALESGGYAVNQQNLFAMTAALYSEGCVNVSGSLCGSGLANFENVAYEGAGGWENSVDIVAVASGDLADPYATLDAVTPVNRNNARLSGFEFAFQHFFGETGFGTQLNYTIVNGDVEFDIREFEDAQFALTGLSDSANVVLIFDKYNINARLAYNWRDEFLSAANVGGNEPQHTEDYGQIDFNIGYQITDQLSVGFEAINITEEDKRDFGRTEKQLRGLEIYGARYALTGRFTF